MSKYLMPIVIVASMVLLAPAGVLADDGPAAGDVAGYRVGKPWQASQKRHRYRRYVRENHRVDYRRGVPVHAAVPELDLAAAGSATLLLLGGLAVLAGRRRHPEVIGSDTH